MTTNDSTSQAVPRVRDIPADKLPAMVHPGWAIAFPWLVQGTTTRGGLPVPFDLGLYSSGSSESVVRDHWSHLLRATSITRAVHAPQPHGAEVRVHRRVGRTEAGDEVGLHLVEPCDGHLTDQPDVLLSVAVADCVPVFVVDARTRAIAVLHAGWRGASAGVLENGLSAMVASFGSAGSDLHLHFGPSICGDCYEVGGEVFAAMDQPVPDGNAPIDLRALLAARAVARGVREDRISISEHCTRCTASELFSHRGGDAHRQVAYLGIRR
jgi:YfiH family protein